MGACSGKAALPVVITDELRTLMKKYRLEETDIQMFYNKFVKFDKDHSGTIDVV
jgi:Ca2+-binding EF-hand superfamily protein